VQFFDKSGYAAQFVKTRLRLRLWPSGWWIVFGASAGDPIIGLARFDADVCPTCGVAIALWPADCGRCDGYGNTGEE
jgi:hypothetical protein